jgi:3-polyprenyl-4-hydroxybenzoate decarboxylase
MWVPINKCQDCGESNQKNFYAKTWNRCKACEQAHRKARRTAHPELRAKAVESTRIWRASNLLGKRIHHARARAHSKKMKFNINRRYIEQLWEEQGGLCYYTGLPMTRTPDDRNNSVSLDRVDSTKGYVRGNIVLCRSAINFMKRHHGLNHFVELCKQVAQNMT